MQPVPSETATQPRTPKCRMQPVTAMRTGAWCERPEPEGEAKNHSSSRRSAEAVSRAGGTGSCRCPGGDRRACGMRNGVRAYVFPEDTPACRKGIRIMTGDSRQHLQEMSAKLTDDVDKFRCQCAE